MFYLNFFSHMRHTRRFVVVTIWPNPKLETKKLKITEPASLTFGVVLFNVYLKC